MPKRLAVKIDVDTDRGTRLGVPALVQDCREFGVPACFLFSLGPDQTGRALSRIFRPGFFKKVSRTSVVKVYGVRTLLNGTLLPAPHIGRRHGELMRSVREAGFETGIHCHNHYFWQDHILKLPPEAVSLEFGKALAEYKRIFGESAHTAGAPGWQSGAHTRRAYDAAGLLYSSDTRGRSPFFPCVDGYQSTTLEIPTTLPTLDELLGRPEYPDTSLVSHYLALLGDSALNVLTIHAELEGMACRPFFRGLLAACRKAGVEFVSLERSARALLSEGTPPPKAEQRLGEIDGRSGQVALQA